MLNLGKKENERETSPYLTRGQHRRLRLSKTDPSIASGESSGHRKSPEPKLIKKENSPSNVTVDMQAETDRGRAEMMGQERLGDEREEGKPIPWKLRDRKARVKVDGDQGPSLGTARTDLKSSGKLREQRPDFSVSLSRTEIEEDFEAMMGHPPPRRSMKRRKAVQKKVDKLSPGLWLTEVTPDRYKVDHAETGKK